MACDIKPLIKLNFNRSIGRNWPTLIVAEIGQNHQGSLVLAKELIKTAKLSGADCVKFQKTCIPQKFTKKALLKPYETENSWGITYGDHKEHLEFSEEAFKELQKYANDNDIIFFATAMDMQSLYFLQNIKLPLIKIGSGDANNLMLIKEALRTNIPLIISTGMQNLEMIKTINTTAINYHQQYCFLHCVSSYPTPIDEINLKCVELFQKEFPNVIIGYSGHETGIDVAIAAVAIGAKIIEKHFTLNRNLKGSDHVCSLEPNEFKEMVQRIRLIERALGKAEKIMQPSELPCFNKLSKSVVAARFIHKNHKIQESDLTIKVAHEKAIDASLWQTLIGRKTNQCIDEDEPIQEDYFQKLKL